MIQKNYSPDDIFLGMSEVEKAFYAKYKLNQHSRKKQKELLTFLEKSGLNRKKILEITAKHSFDVSYSGDSCNRCGSLKIYLLKSDNKSTTSNCLICGYEQDQKKRSRRKCFSFLFGS